MPPPPPTGELKTVNVDLNLFGLAGASKAPKPRGRPPARRHPQTQPGVPTAKDIATKSAELQAAVEEALSSASAPKPFPRSPPKADEPTKRPQLHTTPPPSLAEDNGGSDVKVVISELGTPSPEENVSRPTTQAPKEEGIGGALQELNELMARRVRRRLVRTQRAQMERNKSKSLPSSLSDTDAGPVPSEADGQAGTAVQQPRWGNLKNGKLPTYRKFSKTLKANKPSSAQGTVAVGESASVHAPAPGVSFSVLPDSSAAREPKSAEAAPARHPPTVSRTHRPEDSTAPNEAPIKKYSVGKQKSGKIGLILNPGSLGKTRKNKQTGGRAEPGPPGRRTITARNKMRKAGLLRGSANVPQRLVDVMCSAVEQIGVVKRSE